MEERTIVPFINAGGVGGGGGGGGGGWGVAYIHPYANSVHPHMSPMTHMVIQMTCDSPNP